MARALSGGVRGRRGRRPAAGTVAPHRLPLMAALVAALAAAPAAGPARAQASLDLDTSVRDAGTGGAGVGVAWGDPSVWGNPAAIGLVTGIRWESGRAPLAPRLADGVVLRSTRTLVGAFGAGLALGMDPLGGTRLDYGAGGGGAGGNPLTVLSGSERLDAWGAGVSLAGIVDAANAVQGRLFSLAPFADLAAGFERKHLRTAVSPGDNSDLDQIDWGVLARVTPTAWAERVPARLRLDLAAGLAVVNAGSDGFTYGFPGPVVLPSQIRRMGFAARAVLPGPWARPRGRGLVGALRAGMGPLADAGLAFDTERVWPRGEPHGYAVLRRGVELTLLGVATVHLGHVTDPAGGVDGPTRGWGLAAPLGTYAGVRFDHASTPQAKGSGLPDAQRRGWTVWVNPLEVWSAMTP